MRIDPTPRRMAWFVVLMHAFALTASCLQHSLAQDMPESPEPLPDIVRDEIIRRGDQIEELGQIRTDSPQAYVFAALAPPPDDSHKWYISLITTENCPWCELLKKHFAETEELRAWVNVTDQAESWAHYNVYRQEDRTQDWRWSKIRIRGYPTIVLQPPRNREWGDPATVVLQKTGYDGNAKALSGQLRRAIQTYVEAMQTRGDLDASAIHQVYEAPYERYKRQSHQQAETEDEPAIERGAGQPPFPVPDRPRDPRLPNPNVPLPNIPGPLDPDRRPMPADSDDRDRATFDELVRSIPGADPGWLTKQIQRGATLGQAKAAWEARQRLWQIGLWVAGALVALILFAALTIAIAVLLARRVAQRLTTEDMILRTAARSSRGSDPNPKPDPAQSQDEKAGSGEPSKQ